MKTRFTKLLLVTILLSASLTGGAWFYTHATSQTPTHVFPRDFPAGQTLRDAIFNETVEDGDTIIVEFGTWPANLLVNKSITLQGFNRYTTVLDGGWKGTAIYVNASNVNIFDFTIQNASGTGVLVHSVGDCNISRNVVKNNRYGVELWFATHCTLRSNDIRNNEYNFDVEGNCTEHMLHDVDESNTVDLKPVYYWVNRTVGTIPSGAGYVALVNCTNIYAANLHLRNSRQGILIMSSANCTLQELETRHMDRGVLVMSSTNVTIKNLDAEDSDTAIRFQSTNESRVEKATMLGDSVGVELWNSSNNTLRNNTIVGATIGVDVYWFSCGNNVCDNVFKDNYCGIQLGDCTDNTFCRNNFFNNTSSASSGESGNRWDNGYEGNYWSDYSGVGDLNGDGINEGQYNRNMPLERDRYPLNKPWSPCSTIDVTWYADTIRKYNITIMSDHVVANCSLRPDTEKLANGSLFFNVTAGSSGYFNVTFPRDRLDQPFELYINSSLVDSADYEVDFTRDFVSLCYNFSEGRHRVNIICCRLGTVCGDLNGDGTVNMRDIGIVCNNFGARLPPLCQCG